jgi:acetoacetyl-CoA synthetase
MMWNLMVAGLAWGAHLVLYDGSPLHPSPENFLRLIHDQGYVIFGIRKASFQIPLHVG